MFTLATKLTEENSYLGIIGITLAVAVLVVVGIWWGWRARRRRQHNIPAPARVPEEILASQPVASSEGLYVTTVTGQDLLERVAVHGLGVRTEALLEAHAQGVAIMMVGGHSIFIPRQHLVEVFTTSGMAGKFVEKDGIIAVTWTLGDTLVTTGVRAKTTTEHQQLLSSIKQLTNSSPIHQGSEI